MINFATEAEARAYLLPPSSRVLFMDPSASVFYVKSTDVFGKPDFVIADFTIRSPHAQSPSPAPYITRAEFEEFKAQFINKEDTTHANQPTISDTEQSTSATGNPINTTTNA